MRLRKEQSLFLVALLIAVWLGTTFEVSNTPRKLRPKGLPDVEFAGRNDILADPSLAPKDPQELFLEPSETRPLEPKQDLAFPVMKKLQVVLLPLELGQHPGALSGLRRDASVLTLAAGGDTADRDNNNGNGNAAAAPNIGEDRASRYDRIYHRNGQTFWGLWVGAEDLKFKLALNPAAFREGTPIHFQWIKKDGTRNGPPWTHDAKDYHKLELAKTLRNHIGLREATLVPAKHNTPKQRDFIMYLLHKARLETWVFKKALRRAEIYKSFVSPKEEGYLYLAKVLRAKGDLDAEWKLFKQLEDELQGSSFQRRGLGLIEARLGLSKSAEEHLRAAVKLNTPIDPRNYAALATFLLDSGRAEEAVEFAEKAVYFIGRRNPIQAEQVGFKTLLVRAHLAVGNIESAKAAMENGVFTDPYLINEARYQSACIAYAEQDLETATTDFQACYNSGLVPDALLGLAACKFATGEASGALADFERCADENPRMRHLALAGMGLVLGQVAGRGADALEKIDASLVANPIHPYTLYLQGRQRRLAGDAQGAVEALKQSLRQQDGFIEALAELTQTYFTIYNSTRDAGNRDAGALLSAIRYVDRLVELDQKHGTKEVLFLEMQGKIHFEARDFHQARRAFEAGKKVGSKFSEIGLGLLDYLQKRTERSQDRLQRMIRDLGSTSPELRSYIENILDEMRAHSNLEKVEVQFKTDEMARKWEHDGDGRTKLKPKNGELTVEGELRQGRPVFAFLPLAGSGRFVEFSIDMKVTSDVEFAGAVIEMPGRGATPSKFRVKLGVDDRGKVFLAIINSTKPVDPIQTNIDVTKDQWHNLRFEAYTDPTKKKNPTLFLRVSFDDQVIHDARVKGIRRNAGASSPFNTGVRVEGRRRSKVHVSFRNFLRIQLKK